MSKHDKSKAGQKKRRGRLWGVDAVAFSLLVMTALLVQAAYHASGGVQAWAVFVASTSAALGLGLLLRYAPARQVAMLMLAMVLVIEALVFTGTANLGTALAGAGTVSLATWSPPPPGALVRLAAAAVVLLYLARPRVAQSFRR